jgi:hypothetical protein
MCGRGVDEIGVEKRWGGGEQRLLEGGRTKGGRSGLDKGRWLLTRICRWVRQDPSDAPSGGEHSTTTKNDSAMQTGGVDEERR